MSVIKDCLIGYAVGDAFGLPFTGSEREKLLSNPITSMEGSLEHDIEAGTWSNNTSLTLATMDSIVKCGKINSDDIVERLCSWINDSSYMCTDRFFKVSDVTKKAILKYTATRDSSKCGCVGYGEDDNDNDSVLRMFPIAIYSHYNHLQSEEVYNLVKSTSSITHANEVSILGCYIFVNFLMFLLNGKDKFSSYNMIKFLDYSYFDPDTVSYYNRLLKTNINKLRVSDLRSEKYIVYTIETVLWVILNCRSFAESIVGAVNLGGDTDSIGAMVGGCAGIIYGLESIPPKWINTLKKLEYLNIAIEEFESIF